MAPMSQPFAPKNSTYHKLHRHPFSASPHRFAIRDTPLDIVWDLSTGYLLHETWFLPWSLWVISAINKSWSIFPLPFRFKPNERLYISRDMTILGEAKGCRCCVPFPIFLLFFTQALLSTLGSDEVSKQNSRNASVLEVVSESHVSHDRSLWIHCSKY